MSRRRKANKKTKKRRKKQRLDDATNQFCWDLGRLMQANKRKSVDKSKVNDKSFCPDCNQYFCLGYDLKDVYCKGCFYEVGCMKEIRHRRRCQKCEFTCSAHFAKGG